MRDTSTKKNGMKSRSMKVADNRPPVTAVPMAFWAPAPAPLVSASGRVPKKKASEVMMTGRSRIFTACRVASMSSSPWCSWSLMNWMIRMAFLVDSPTVVRRPICR